MPRHIRSLFAISFTSLALAPVAYADTSSGSSNPYWQGADPQWQGGSDPQWQGGSDPGWNDTPSTPGAPTTPSAPATQQPVWDPTQGNPQETPSQQQQSPMQDPWAAPALPVAKTPTVPGTTAMIRRNGLAAVPQGAPAAVRAIITAANQIIGKPYKWGGGHGRLFDTGYDCSGTVSYALIRSGLLSYPMVSGTLAHWGMKGAGKYVTIYANKAHVYMEVAGLRLDTSSVGDPSGKSGVRWRPPIGKRFGFAVRHIAGL